MPAPGRVGWAVGFVGFVCAGALSERTARAQPPAIEGPPEPTVAPYVDRGMLYGPGQGGFALRIRGSDGFYGGIADASVGLALGISQRLTIDGTLGTLTFAPTDGGAAVRYRGPEVGLWLGLVDTPVFELDATTHLAFGVAGPSIFEQVEPGMVAVLRGAHAVRLDVGAYVPVPLDGVRGPGLHMPISLAAQISPEVHFAVTSGLTFDDLGDDVTRTSVPLGLSLGWTVPIGSGGYTMITPSVSWPRFISVQTGDNAPSGPGPLVVGATLAIVTPP